MKSVAQASDVERFRSAIAHRLGLFQDDDKLAQLREVLERRVEVTGLPIATYLDALDTLPSRGDELRELARALTVTETYFFRNGDQFRAFAEVVLPDRIASRSEQKRLSFLSAGCASGEEAYSLAMIVHEHSLNTHWNVSILGADLNPAVLERAAKARYTTWSMRETPADVQRRWFKSEGNDLVLDSMIRDAVTFEEHNLLNDAGALFFPERFDAVFCRNVLMYLTPAAARVVVDRITRALAPGGYLFLGHAETLRGLSHDYHLLHTHETFYYQKKEALGSKPYASETPLAADMPVKPLVLDTSWTTSWIDTVDRASQRIETLSDQRTEHLEPHGATQVVPEATDVSAAMNLLEEGELSEAERVCQELLELDELSAGAHYLLALCREAQGDQQAAIEHDRIAVYLDPTFAMPRLHLGLLARRSGDRETAEHELSQALALVAREDASRLVLFGGGFSRDALTALVLAELGAKPGKP